MFRNGTAGVDKRAEWHEQLNSTFMKHNSSVFTNLTLKQLLTKPSSSTLSNLSSLNVYKASPPEYKYAEYLSSVRCTQTEGCLAGLDMDAMVCMSTQGRWVETKREDRLCQMCHSSKDVEDEQWVDCPNVL